MRCLLVEKFKLKFNKKIAVIVISCLLIIGVCIFLFIDHRLHDRDKPNIFEIPGTAYSYTSAKKIYLDRHFMVQKKPDNEEDIKQMISEFIASEDIVRESFSKSVDCVKLHFYTPSIEFPVYFEENKNYFIMDDYITHYHENEFLLVDFVNSFSDGKYIFYYDGEYIVYNG